MRIIVAIALVAITVMVTAAIVIATSTTAQRDTGLVNMARTVPAIYGD